jgi:hypothetical protein
MPLGRAGCCRGRVFLAGPMSDSLAPWGASSYRDRARRERLPPRKTGAPSILANAKAAPHPERASNGFVIGASMPDNELKLVRVAKVMQSTSSFADRLGTRRGDPRICEEGVEPPLTSGFKINEQFNGISRPPAGRVRL